MTRRQSPSTKSLVTPAAVTMAALTIALSLILWSPYGSDLYLLVITPIVCLICLSALLGAAVSKKLWRFLSIVLSLVMFLGTSWAVLKYSNAVRPRLRWLLWSRDYKAQLLATPKRGNELRHLEWDAWGFVPSGEDTVYLVFDPSDSLALPARTGAPGRFKGIPCEVPEVHRLEPQWYFVQFYTDEQWDQCPFSSTPQTQPEISKVPQS